MKNKRGQFYIISAIIISTIIISLATIINYSHRENTSTVNDIGEELKIETQKVLDYEYSTKDSKMDQFGKDYSQHIGDGIDLYLITGNSSDIHINKYTNGNDTALVRDVDFYVTDSQIILPIEDVNYTFSLATKTDNFYFLVNQKIKGENYVFSH